VSERSSKIKATDPPARKRLVRWTLRDEKGRSLAGGEVRASSDRSALSWVLQGRWRDDASPALEPDRTYRISAGDCSAVAEGRELADVDRAATLDEARLMTPERKHLYDEPRRPKIEKIEGKWALVDSAGRPLAPDAVTSRPLTQAQVDEFNAKIRYKAAWVDDIYSKPFSTCPEHVRRARFIRAGIQPSLVDRWIEIGDVKDHNGVVQRLYDVILKDGIRLLAVPL